MCERDINFDTICQLRELETSFAAKGKLALALRAERLADELCGLFWGEDTRWQYENDASERDAFVPCP